MILAPGRDFSTNLLVKIMLISMRILMSDCLRRENKSSLTFSELKVITQIPNDAVLDYHLKKLIDAGLIVKMPSQKTLRKIYCCIQSYREMD